MSDSHKLAVAYILTEADNDQLNAIIDAVKMRRERLSRVNRFAMRVGTAVKFEHKGIEYHGTVKAVRVKKAVVECVKPTHTTYTVPLNMLQTA